MAEKNKKYIVTGGAGFIGSHIVDTLIGRGDKVVVIDNLSTGKKEHINLKAEFHQLDIRDKESIAPVFKGADGIFHLAALARIQPSFESPEKYFDNNALGTKNILELAKQNNVKRVVYSASSSAYGHKGDQKLTESMELTAQALSPYSSTKRMGEMLMKDMGKMTGGPETVCLRYFNVYGPRQTTSLDGPYATVIGIFLDQWKNKKPFTFVPFEGKPLGSQRRAFTYVSDVVEANLLAMESEKAGDGEIINIGTKENSSIKEVAELIGGKDYPYVEGPERKNEVFETIADIQTAKELISWEPKISIEEGIKKLKEQMS